MSKANFYDTFLRKNNDETIAVISGEDVSSYRLLKLDVNTLVHSLTPFVCSRKKALLLIENGIEWIVTFFALSYMGMTITLASHEITEEELKHVIHFSKPEILLCSRHTVSYDSAQAYISCRGASIGVNVVENSEKPIEAVDYDVELYTSGTSGLPKRVGKTVENLLFAVTCVQKELDIKASDRVLCSTPFCHNYGFTVGLLNTFSSGGTVVTGLPLTGRQLANHIVSTGVNIIISVPLMYSAWKIERQHSKNINVKFCLSAGQKILPSTKKEFESSWRTKIFSVYGMTECGEIAISNVESDPDSVGKVLDGIDVTIKTLPNEKLGRIVVKSPSSGTTFLGESILHQNGDAVVTDDIGWVSDTNTLYVVGRHSEHINVNGRKVDPSELENALVEHSAIEVAKVLGYKGENDISQKIIAFIVAKGLVTDGEIITYLRSKVSRYKLPNVIYRLDKLPMSQSGKIKTKDLLLLAKKLF